jgi:hypothetical protein
MYASLVYAGTVGSCGTAQLWQAGDSSVVVLLNVVERQCVLPNIFKLLTLLRWHHGHDGFARGLFRESGGRDRGEGVKQACRYVRGSNMLCHFFKSVSQATMSQYHTTLQYRTVLRVLLLLSRTRALRAGGTLQRRYTHMHASHSLVPHSL